MGKTILTFNDVIELNQVLEEKNMGYKVRLHDRCGSQSFTLESLTNTSQSLEAVKKEIIYYFDQKGMTLSFAEDAHEFSVM